MSKYILILITAFLPLVIISQSTSVQSFNFESTTRDTVIEFPNKDHNSYEKILMHYTMRCKDGLVSTGSDRNLGCGEWDYSCNTYVVDSTRVDSLLARSDEFQMPGFQEDTFNYTNDATYTFYESTKQRVTYDNIITEFKSDFADAQDDADYKFGDNLTSMKIAYIVTADYLLEEDLDRISGIELLLEEGETRIKDLKVKIAQTSESDVEKALATSLNWEEYVNDNYILTPDDNTLKFHEDYRWDDSSNIIIEISYSRAENSFYDLKAENFNETKAVVTDAKDAYYKSFSNVGGIRVDHPFNDIENEITISYWLKGSDILPIASTTLEANDSDNRRQVNIHHPWANGQIFFDCGNDGSNYDRINKPTDNDSQIKNQWNHWAFTKNAISGEMKIYLNGEVWHSGSDKFRPIDMNALNIGGSITSNNLFYYGDMDEVRIWNKELDQATIKSYMQKSVDDTHPNKENLKLYYKFDSEDPEIVDHSGNNKKGIVNGIVNTRKWDIENFNFDTKTSNFLPNHKLIKGFYMKSVEEVKILDSLINFPQLVNHYQLNGTDIELVWSENFYEAKEANIYNEEGEVVGTRSYDIDGTFEKGELIYFNKVPMAYEIMSFVTPYGIGLDFGLEGLTWTFDVTDFGPILKNNKRIYLTGGGQWQEDMDIRFEFVEGTPDRDVIDITQIWPVRSTGYQNILSDWRYEPRQFIYDSNVDAYKIRTAITGHGQEGEFIPRNHSIKVAEFIDSWSVWKECSENPVYPQGGTWVYDRAGWCPGMATDVREFDVTEFFQFLQTPTVDYSISTATGDSRYYVNSQLIEYGKPNKQNDSGIASIINPSQNIEYGKFNPACSSPVITIKNHGAESLKTAIIKYGIVGVSELTYEWTGNLEFLNERRIELPAGIDLTLGGEGSEFFARIESANDEAESNNELRTIIDITDHYTDDIIIEMRTNNVPVETSYAVKDIDGNTILQRIGGSLSSNTIYRDTLSNLNGCFQLEVTDTDGDGISWWANNDGNGYVRVKQDGENWQSIATDFGSFVNYTFTSGIISNTTDLELIKDVRLYPNPGSDNILLSNLDNWDNTINVSVSNMSGQMIFNQNMSKVTLDNRPLKVLNNLDEGIYFINLRDSDKISSLRFVKM